MYDAKVDNKPDTRAKFLICSGEIDWSVAHGPAVVKNERVLAYANDYGDMIAEMVRRPDATFVKMLTPDLNGDLKYHMYNRMSLSFQIIESFNKVRAHFATLAAQATGPLPHFQV